MKQIPFRSISFHQSNPDLDLIRLAARLGFNNVELQTEHPQFRKWLGLTGSEEDEDGGAFTLQQVPGLQAVRRHVEQAGLFEELKKLGMSLSLWTRELEDIDPAWGDISLDNERLWNELRQRYDYFLGELFPELKYLWVTVAESRTWVTDPAIISKIYTVILDSCRAHDCTLVARAFAYENQREGLVGALQKLPEDVVIGTKYGPRDWHMRGIPNPATGVFTGHREFVEEDICGEYYFTNAAANCMADHFLPRFEHCVNLGVEGFVLRVNRGWDMGENQQGSIYGEVQEANLWAWAHCLNGHGREIDVPLLAWASATFPEKIAEEAVEIFRPTGRVIEEAVCCGPEPFGDTRIDVPALRQTGGVMGWQRKPYLKAQRFSDEDAERFKSADGSHKWPLHISPLHETRASHPHDPSFLADYHRYRKGEPSAIAEKTEGCATQLQSIERSIARWRTLQEKMPADCFAFFLFRLEEARRRLIFWCEAQLAWLKASRCLYAPEAGATGSLRDEIKAHLQAMEALDQWYATNYPVKLDWKGRHFVYDQRDPHGASFVENFSAHFENVLA